jgi:hypothetical protein
MQTLRWMRMVGDTVFAIGAVAWVWFAINLMITKGDPQPASERASFRNYSRGGMIGDKN